MLVDKYGRAFNSAGEAADYYCSQHDRCSECPLYSDGHEHFCDATIDDVMSRLGLIETDDDGRDKIAVLFGVGDSAADAKSNAEKEVFDFSGAHVVRSVEFDFVSGWPNICAAKVVYK